MNHGVGYVPSNVTGAAAQLLTDQAAVLAAAARIQHGIAILGQTGTQPRGLPVTGQTTIYQAGDDGHFQCGRKPGTTPALIQLFGDPTAASRFTDNGDGTVTDNETGLMWSKTAASEAIAWSDAIDAALASTQAGYSDWRVPNILEAQSIVNFVTANLWTPFEPPMPPVLWSATTDSLFTLQAWTIFRTLATYTGQSYDKTVSPGVFYVRGGIFNNNTP
jgi:hypothetical protein